MPKSCFTKTVPKSASLDALVIKIPVAMEINREGIWLLRPSPMVSTPKDWIASAKGSPWRRTPMTVPPIKFTKVMIRPAVASPFTYFVAPSMAPKKFDSIWIFSRRILASFSVMVPVFKSASIAICLPGIASKVKRAVTSATLSEPLLITTNCIIIRIMNTIAPIIKSPPPTNPPNVRTTFPGSPVVKIKRVEETFKEIRNNVVNNSSVGKNDMSKTSWTKSALNNTINAMEILIANMQSNKMEGIGTMKNMTAQSKYKATPTSAFFILHSPPSKYSLDYKPWQGLLPPPDRVPAESPARYPH